MSGRVIARRKVRAFFLPVLTPILAVGVLAGCQPVASQLATSNAGAGIPVTGAPATNQTISPAKTIVPVLTETTASPSSTEISGSDTGNYDNQNQTGSEADADIPVVAVAAIAPAPKPPELPATPSFTPQSQIGKTKDSLNLVIGVADFIRQDGQIEIMQYHQPDCVVDFYIQLGDAGAGQISGWDMRARIFGGRLDIQLCEAQLADRTP
jgi:hypothetical protein